MLPYDKILKQFSRDLRSNQTVAEELLWSHIRKKQLMGMQFYRQKPIAGYIADFYCAKAQLVIELDGEVHNSIEAKQYDAIRDQVMQSLGLTILRFTNQQVETELPKVIEDIKAKLISPFPSLQKRGVKS